MTALGGLAEVERRGDVIVVRGLGCPLGEVVQIEPRACVALQSLLEELIGVPVRESCERGERPSCRFEIDLPDHAA